MLTSITTVYVISEVGDIFSFCFQYRLKVLFSLNGEVGETIILIYFVFEEKPPPVLAASTTSYIGGFSCIRFDNSPWVFKLCIYEYSVNIYVR